MVVVYTSKTRLKGEPVGLGRRSPHQVMHMQSVLYSTSAAESRITWSMHASRQCITRESTVTSSQGRDAVLRRNAGDLYDVTYT